MSASFVQAAPLLMDFAHVYTLSHTFISTKEARGATLGMEAPGVRGEQGELSTAMRLTAASTSGGSGLLFWGVKSLVT